MTDGKPAGYAGKGRRSKEFIGEEKGTVDSVTYEFCDEFMRRRCESWEKGGGKGGEREICGSSKVLNPEKKTKICIY